MGYYLNPTELTAMFAVPASVADKHLKLASAEQLKVLLWCLKNADRQYAVDAVCSALGIDGFAAKDALDFWSERGVLCSTAEVSVASEPEKKPKATKRAVTKPGRDEVARRGLEDGNIAFILRETEQKFGRILRQNEMSTLVWMYDDLGLSPSLIMMIVGFAVTEGKATVSFIENTAVDWVNKGIEDIEAADRMLVELRRKTSCWHTVETAMGLDRRRPSAAELEMADLWITEWGYDREIIRAAYDACIDATSKISMPYIKKVISEWHKSGVKTVGDIAAVNSRKDTGSKQSGSSNQSDYSDFIQGIISQNEEDE